MSEHFTLEELLHSDTAKSRGIENLPSWENIDHLIELANLLEKIRTMLGNKPMVVSSGFRCPALNQCVGGASNSAHLYGYAADFVCPAFGSPTQVVNHLKPHLAELGIDQLIDETGWVHVGLRDGEPRCQCFRI